MIEICDLQYQHHGALTSGLSLSFSGKGLHGILCADLAEVQVLAPLVAGCDEPEAGRVSLQRKSGEVPAVNAKDKIGYLPYALALYEDMTPTELLDFVGTAKKVPAERRYGQIKEALELALLEREAKTPLAALSPYARRRVLLAQALLGNPAYIVLEEPFGDLKKEEREELEAIVSSIGSIKPVLILSHDDTVAARCEDVAVVFRGNCRFFGTGAQLAETLSEQVVERPVTASEYFDAREEENA